MIEEQTDDGSRKVHTWGVLFTDEDKKENFWLGSSYYIHYLLLNDD